MRAHVCLVVCHSSNQCAVSGSDDQTLRVWDISQTYKEESKVLLGHKDNVRALVWNTEIPYMVMSGVYPTALQTICPPDTK